MARTNNKYTSINFNHIYEKNNLTNNTTAASAAANPTKLQSQSSPSPSSSLYSSVLSPNKNHGRMLVLTRPTPKPISSTTTLPLSPPPHFPPTQQTQPPVPDQNPSEPEMDRISLRTLGRTGTRSSPLLGTASPVLGHDRSKDVGTGFGSPKPDKFVPPHLRPGFAGREERPGPDVLRGKEPVQRQQPGHFGSPGRYGEDGRPKSGGYERMRRGGEPDPGLVNRPGSSGTRPSSSGCCSGCH